jgi:excisionase family DNA binding protein
MMDVVVRGSTNAIRMARERTIPALRVGEKHWRFRRSDLEMWVEQ